MLSVPTHYFARGNTSNIPKFSYSFVSIGRLFDVPRIPTCLSGLFSSSTSSSSSITTTTRSGKASSEIPVNSPFAGLCNILLAILRNLFSRYDALKEVAQANLVQPLLHLLNLDSQLNNHVLIVHKQLVRCLSAFAATSYRTVEGLEILQLEVFIFNV